MLYVSPPTCVTYDIKETSAEYIGELHELTIWLMLLLFVSPESLILNSLWREVLSSNLNH